MHGTLFEEWFHKLDCKCEMEGTKVIMTVDNCRPHPEVSGLKAINLQFLPPNTTSCTQIKGQSGMFALLFSYFISKVNRIIIECLDFAVESLHCLKNSLITKIEA